jgi:hypothetical protein
MLLTPRSSYNFIAHSPVGGTICGRRKAWYYCFAVLVIKVVSPAARERKIRERLEGGQAERSVELGLYPEDGFESGSESPQLHRWMVSQRAQSQDRGQGTSGAVYQP